MADRVSAIVTCLTVLALVAAGIAGFALLRSFAPNQKAAEGVPSFELADVSPGEITLLGHGSAVTAVARSEADGLAVFHMGVSENAYWLPPKKEHAFWVGCDEVILDDDLIVCRSDSNPDLRWKLDGTRNDTHTWAPSNLQLVPYVLKRGVVRYGRGAVDSLRQAGDIAPDSPSTSITGEG